MKYKKIFAAAGIMLALSFYVNNEVNADENTSIVLDKTDYTSQFEITSPAKLTFQYNEESKKYLPVVNGTTGNDVITFTFQKEYTTKGTADSTLKFVWNIDENNKRTLEGVENSENPDLIYNADSKRNSTNKFSTGASSFEGDLIDSDFINKAYTGSNGNAIYHSNKGLNLESVTGDFVSNTAEISSGSTSSAINGGLIYNLSGIKKIVGNFIANTTKSNGGNITGGLIKNNSGASIGEIQGNFIGNKAINTNYYTTGGAIFNSETAIIGDSSLKDKAPGDEFEKTDVITGDFINNTIESKQYAQGGAILNRGQIIGNIKGSFTGNGIESTNTIQGNNVGGGAISAIFQRSTPNSGRIYGNIEGDFINNYAKSDYMAYGGAISLQGTTLDGSIKGDFIGNYAESSANGIVRGGAIYASSDSNNTTSGIYGDVVGNFIRNSALGTSSVGGGAFYTDTKIRGNLQGDFIDNHTETTGSYSQVEGGALNNSGRIYGNVEGSYENNSLISKGGKALGGAIYNYGMIGYNIDTGEVEGKLDADFKNNIAKSASNSAQGGALYVGNTSNTNTGKIASIEGDFISNTADGNKGSGGAIYNSGVIGQKDNETPALKGSFESNKAISKNAGTSYADIGSGGAIYNNNNNGDIYGIEAKFSENEAKTAKGKVKGGAIYELFQYRSSNDGKGISYIINSKFSKNKAIAEEGEAQGGALAHYFDATKGDGTMEVTDSSFSENLAQGALSAKGGAISLEYDRFTSKGMNYKISNSQDLEDKATFKNNSAISDLNAQGGAIYNSYEVAAEIENVDFRENQVKSTATSDNITGGGAIFNEGGDLIVKDSNFINNKAIGSQAKGGAIYSKDYQYTIYGKDEPNIKKGIVNIIAQAKDVLFKGNTVQTDENAQAVSNAIYDDGGALNLNAATDKKIKFDDSIVTASETILNINKEGDWDRSQNIALSYTSTLSGVPLDAPIGGTIVMNADMSGILGNVNLYGGAIEFKENSKFFNQAKIAVEAESKLSFINNKIEEISFKDLTLNDDLKIGVDANLETGKADLLSAETVSAIENKGLVISDINLVVDNGANKVNIASESLKDYITLAQNADLNIEGAKNSYVVSYDNTTGDIKFNPADSLAASMAIAKDGEIYGMTKDEAVSQPLGAPSADKYGVNGGGNSIKGENVSGFEVTSDKSLGLTNIKSVEGFVSEDGGAVSNEGELIVVDTSFKNNSARRLGGAIYNKQNATTTITANKTDVVFEENTDSTGSSAINNDGGDVILNADNKNIIMNDEIINRGTLALRAKGGNILFNKRITGTTKADDIITIEQTQGANGEVQFNNTVSNHTVNQTTGTAAFLDNGGFDNTVDYNVSGGSISLESNSINTANLGNLVLKGDVNLKLDADLKNKEIDQIKLESFSANDYNININDIIILEPTTEDEILMSPLESVTDESLRQALSSAIRYKGGDLTYSPVFKYSAKFNSDDGNFTFTRLASSPTRPSYSELNPAIVANPVAAQVGGYLTQLNNYENAFSVIDSKMMLPKRYRQMASMENLYAIHNDEMIKPYKLNAVKERDEGWFRPFTAVEKVGLKDGPKVSNVMYGAYFGTKGKLKRLKNGKELQTSFHLGYNGSRQSYAGNSILQNGGILGITTALYKGNLFTAFTVGAGANVASSSTNLGSETFPMLMAGIANKTGFNIELWEGKFIIQPNLTMSYSFINTLGDQTYGTARVSGDPLHALQFSPGVKFIANLGNSWQPYFSVTARCNFIDDTKFKVQEVTLPELSVKPYVEMAAGLQKLLTDKIGGFFQSMVRLGGRTGVAFSAGINILLGKSESL